MGDRIRVISPVDGRVLVERPLASDGAIAATWRAPAPSRQWRDVPVAERAACWAARSTRWSRAGTSSRPRSPGRWAARSATAPARSGASRSAPATCWRQHPGAGRPSPVGDKPGFTRFIRREPLGLVFVIAPWNYPYLTAVNSIVPALVAGNVVLLKHSAQTPLCAERFQEASTRPACRRACSSTCTEPRCGIADRRERRGRARRFTGSVPAGHACSRPRPARSSAPASSSAARTRPMCASDADLAHAVENLVDGACFNSGQSCCGIERIYVHRAASTLRRGLAELARSTSWATRPTRRPRSGRWSGPPPPTSPAARSTRPWRRAPAP